MKLMTELKWKHHGTLHIMTTYPNVYGSLSGYACLYLYNWLEGITVHYPELSSFCLKFMIVWIVYNSKILAEWFFYYSKQPFYDN